MVMQVGLAALNSIEEILNTHAGGWQNIEALSAINEAFRKIYYEVSFHATAYSQKIDEEHATPFDPGYVSEKLSSLKGSVETLYSVRKHEKAGGVDVVKRNALLDCSLLRRYLERPWVRDLALQRQVF